MTQQANDRTDGPTVATGLAYDPATRDWTMPVRFEARSRMEAIRWMNFNRDWMKELRLADNGTANAR